jgi:hypothetical protein
MGAGSSLQRYTGEAAAVPRIKHGPWGPIHAGVENWDEAVSEAAEDALNKAGLKSSQVGGAPNDGAVLHADGKVRVTIVVS